MILLRALVLVTLVGTICGFAPVPKPKPKKVADLAALAGNWVVVRYQQRDRNHINNQEQLHARIEKDRLTFYVNARGDKGSTYNLSVDTKVTPATMDWHSTDNDRQVRYVAIHSLEGDVLTMVFAAVGAPPDRNRPRSFTDLRPGDYLIAMKRVSGAP